MAWLKRNPGTVRASAADYQRPKPGDWRRLLHRAAPLLVAERIAES
jgi:hypothetical protein